MARQKKAKKPFGADVTNWAIYDLSAELKTQEAEDEFRKRCAGCAPMNFTGQVVEDHLGRWQNGSCMRSSLIVSIDFETWVVETQNTLYRLCGPGRITTSPPGDYEYEVGKTIFLLNPTGGMSVEDPGDNILIYPDRPETIQPFRNLARYIRKHYGS